MEDTEIINLWKSYDKRLEENLLLHRKNAADILKIKARSFLVSMRPSKLFAVLAGIVWVFFIDILIFNLFAVANPFFIVSAIIQVLLTKLAIALYLYQLIVIGQTDISKPILATQQKLARLKSSTLWIARILFLQLPLWTIFYWNESMLENRNPALYFIQITVTFSFTFLAVWLFFHIKYENRDKKWFRIIFKGKEWDPLIKSMELLNEIAEYENEKSPVRQNTGN